MIDWRAVPPGESLKNLLNQLRPAVRDLAAELLYGVGITRPTSRGSSQLNVVTFHRVLPEELLRSYPLAEIAVTVAEFSWFVDFFASNFTVGTLAETCGRWAAGERPTKPFLAITFDDGQQDNHAFARPVLDEAGLRASFFVPVKAVQENETLWHDRLGYAAARALETSRLDAHRWFAELGVAVAQSGRAAVQDLVQRSKGLSPERRERFIAELEASVGGPVRPEWDGMMSWDALRALVGAGHEVGSHSMTHQILVQLDDAALEYEVAESRRILERELRQSVDSFCYPNGDADGRVIEAVRRAGFARAVSTGWGPNRPGAPTFQLTRCDIQSRTSRARGGELSTSRVAFRLSPLHPGP